MRTVLWLTVYELYVYIYCIYIYCIYIYIVYILYIYIVYIYIVYIYVYIYICTRIDILFFHIYQSVVPHKAVAEVSKIGNYGRGEVFVIHRRANPLMIWWIEKWLRLWVSLSLTLSLSPSLCVGVRFLIISASKSAPIMVFFLEFWLGNALPATAACSFLISHLPQWLCTRRFSEPTFRPSSLEKHTVSRFFLTFRAPASSFF